MIKPYADVAGCGVADDFHLMPGVFFPWSASIAPGGDRTAISFVNDVDLVMCGISFFAKMHVVKLISAISSKGDAEIIVAFVEGIELTFEG